MEAIKSLLDVLKIDPADADLLFDLKFLTQDEEAFLADRVVSALSLLPFAADWRSVFLGASAFPEDMQGIKPPTVKERPIWP